LRPVIGVELSLRGERQLAIDIERGL